MAQTQNKKKTSSANATKKKTTAASSKKSGSRSASSAKNTKRPIRREVGGIVFLILALFSGVGYVQSDAIFIHFFANLLKGLFGYGFWIIPPAFLLTGVILLVHHGRPVRLRVGCTLVLPVAVGVILQILLCRETFDSTIAIVPKLYTSGIALSSGGVVCGGIGYGFEQLFGAFASVTVCILLTVVCLMVALKINPKRLYEKARENRVEYEPEPEKEVEAVKTAPTGGITVKETTRQRRPQIDIPLDNEPESVIRSRAAAEKKEEKTEKPERTGFFNRNSNVPKPHESLENSDVQQPAAAAETAAVVTEAAPSAPVEEKKLQAEEKVSEESAESAAEVKLPSKKQMAAEVAAATAEEPSPAAPGAAPVKAP